MANKNTIALHHGHNPKDSKDAVAVPLHLTTAYDFGTSESAAARFIIVQGAGAGIKVTARGVFGNALRIASMY